MTDRPAPGTPIAFRWRKWDGSPHWVNECVYLGADEYGDWMGQPVGWRSARPGASFIAESPNVTLIPASGDYVPTFHRDHPRRLWVYIDLAWDMRWTDAGEPEATDMDLDVVRADDGRGIWIDDRDEWDEHRVQFGYPDDVVAHLDALASDLERRVRTGEAPFDDAVREGWLDRLVALGLERAVEHHGPTDGFGVERDDDDPVHTGA
ncbi:DUF402 domain-containing protein [Microbacterium sp. ASV49]|uniref:DUF402 domain-containing protein n=1 Tax=Microbacterium candidum TaxID=3041922 RepID=A0ABT7N4D6_9MICO|nr:DUF402 domain-containing protein [Microbacterium sp. ASV49]MDL9981575.1 DUF402 domain-containing protein [Microbacterium sp. ASV49]